MESSFHNNRHGRTTSTGIGVGLKRNLFGRDAFNWPRRLHLDVFSLDWDSREDSDSGVNDVFGAKYLRRPNNNDIDRLLQIGETCEFPERALAV
ncbi:hypothetical protein CR513_25650, partial [Mucuna pruriens]